MSEIKIKFQKRQEEEKTINIPSYWHSGLCHYYAVVNEKKAIHVCDMGDGEISIHNHISLQDPSMIDYADCQEISEDTFIHYHSVVIERLKYETTQTAS
jgi:hypothetical protein